MVPAQVSWWRWCGGGDAIAGEIGMSGLLFAATVLAAATSLPEMSTGLASVRLGDDQLAFSDIFGGNAFLPVLFLLASLPSGTAVLLRAGASDLYLAGLGALLTAIHLYGLVFRPRRQLWRLGFDCPGDSGVLRRRHAWLGRHLTGLNEPVPWSRVAPSGAHQGNAKELPVPWRSDVDTRQRVA